MRGDDPGSWSIRHPVYRPVRRRTSRELGLLLPCPGPEAGREPGAGGTSGDWNPWLVPSVPGTPPGTSVRRVPVGQKIDRRRVQATEVAWRPTPRFALVPASPPGRPGGGSPGASD